MLVPICNEIGYHEGIFGHIPGAEQQKVNFFFAGPETPETTHFCGLQSLKIARDSC